MEYTPENITELGPDDIFVFGSNLQVYIKMAGRLMSRESQLRGPLASDNILRIRENAFTAMMP